MAIFLHFLNREAFRASNANYPEKLVSQVLRILTISRNDGLHTNFSNLLESGTLVSELSYKLTRLLLEHNHLLIDGERPSLAEFVDSRASRYHFDSDRYPMYFGKLRVDQDIPPNSVRSASITDYLANEINEIADYKKGLLGSGLFLNDISLIADSLPTLRQLLENREQRAITRSLFSGKLTSQTHEAAVARLISLLYASRYRDDMAGEIVTGFAGLVPFDSLAKSFFSTNFQILNQIIRIAGFSEKMGNCGTQNDEILVNLRGTTFQTSFCEEIAILCAVFEKIAPATNANIAVNNAAAHLNRFNSLPLTPNLSLFANALENLRRHLVSMRTTNRVFASAYEEELMNQGISKTILLVTATKVETRALTSIASAKLNQLPTYVTKERYVCTELGISRNLRLIHVQCEPGSTGPSGSQAVITDAIADWKPSAVILGGIAFGADSTKQKLGDILVSKMVVEYERAKVKENEKVPRGQKIESSPKLLSAFRAAEASYTAASVQVGVLLTGEKLIDSGTFLDQLLDAEPEAIGGEMEGGGLVAAASRQRTEWIVVKAIVDWGRNKNVQNTPEHQQKVAEIAFEFILDTLTRIGM